MFGGWDPIGDIKKGIEHLGGQISNTVNHNLTQVSNGIRDGVAGGLKNAERNMAQTLGGLGTAIMTGDFTGLDRTLLNATMFSLAPVTLFANPDDIDNVTGTDSTEDQLIAKAEQDAKNAAAADAAVKEQERLNGVRDVLTAQASARRRNPGRSAMFTTGGMGGSSSEPLLTLI